jgi:hypothetical protein
MNGMMRLMRYISFIFLIALSGGCGVYTPYGAQTSGARTYSVDYFKSQTPQASPTVALNFTESLKDLIQRQSTLKLVDEDGELRYSGAIVDYRVQPISVQGDETASRNRLTVTVQVRYTNTIEKDLSFDRSFSKFADYDSSSDLLSVEEDLMSQINEQLLQEIFNASLGNW